MNMNYDIIHYDILYYNTYMYVYIYIYTHIYIMYVYTHIYIYIYTCIHTHIVLLSISSINYYYHRMKHCTRSYANWTGALRLATRYATRVGMGIIYYCMLVVFTLADML